MKIFNFKTTRDYELEFTDYIIALQKIGTKECLNFIDKHSIDFVFNLYTQTLMTYKGAFKYTTKLYEEFLKEYQKKNKTTL